MNAAPSLSPAGREAADGARLAASFGPYLRRARIAAGVPLERLADDTRIPLSTLAAIEAEDFSRLPPEVFLRGFLRAYAQAVGADPDEALRRYHARRPPADLAAEREEAPGGGRPRPHRKLAAALFLLAVLVAGSLAIHRTWGPHPEPDPGPGPAAPAEAESAPAAAPSAPATAAPPQAKHALTVSAVEDCWVKVSIDHGTPAEHRLKAGGQITLEAQNGYNLLIGNAGGVRLSLDGRPVPVPGKRGEVVHLQVP